MERWLNSMREILKAGIVLIMSMVVLLTPKGNISSQTISDADVKTTSAVLSVRLAPGEFLPVSVSLSNFGGSKRVDVLLEYVITNSQEAIIFSSSETVAVETTNNFVKTIQIPIQTPEGNYQAITNITYEGQLVPAVSEFTFMVEKKILGFFVSDFTLFGVITLFIGLVIGIFIYLQLRKNKSSRFSPIDYSNIPYGERVFYELTSDTVMAMRQKIGDRALEIASSIEGLDIDFETGRILKLNDKPSKVIAQLVEKYETVGSNVSFSFRKNKN